jgi:hypothetical protein
MDFYVGAAGSFRQAGFIYIMKYLSLPGNEESEVQIQSGIAEL